jgi:hypothetical protein
MFKPCFYDLKREECGSIQEWTGNSGVNSDASFLKETRRVSCSSTVLFFRLKETSQGSLKENLCDFNRSKAHRKAKMI